MRLALIHSPELTTGPIDVAAVAAEVAKYTDRPAERYISICFECGLPIECEFSVFVGSAPSRYRWLCDDDWWKQVATWRRKYRVEEFRYDRAIRTVTEVSVLDAVPTKGRSFWERLVR